ncbi:MAG: hypothetical protein GF383_02375 [Candidatus Lokiarchaeota archaeon]|nr:hypothetical protein [Candidatus Lokiarchaeota archaeon]MBD3338258.1 hypothetical protein [Candidatus Lokiarchaeota archaeon]
MTEENNEMIGDYKGMVKNKVITALLQAYMDTLDYDGMKSILKEAEMLELKDIREVDPEETLDFFSFKKIITAQNCLLYGCYALLFEIGKKFSFYLFPFGKSFTEIVQDINAYIRTKDFKVEILKETENTIKVKVQSCVFCSEIGVPCNLFVGFLVHSLEKSLPSNEKVRYMYEEEENVNDPRHNTYVLTLEHYNEKI